MRTCARSVRLWVLVAVAFLSQSHPSSAEPSFLDLGGVEGLSRHTRVRDLSPDGSVVVGTLGSVFSGVAFVWTESRGMVGLGYPGSLVGSTATGASELGAVIVGWGGGAFAWTEEAGAVRLGVLPGGRSSGATAVSADGSTIVGFSRTMEGLEAFRWTQSGGMVGLGDLPGNDFYSEAFDVSAAGKTVVGQSQGIKADREAFRWTLAEGMVGLGVPPPGYNIGSFASSISADGSTVVGGGRRCVRLVNPPHSLNLGTCWK